MPEPPPPGPGKSVTVLLAFDFGLRRIGVAAGNLVSCSATPLTTIACSNHAPDWAACDSLIAQWQPDACIVGVPESATDALLRSSISQFVQDLQNRYKLPVHTVDEFLTSRAAAAELKAARQAGTRQKRVNKGDIDQYAACLIAESWMRNNQR